MSSLTVSPLISWDIDCSGDTCCSYVSAGCGAACFLLTTGCPKAGGNPACPLGPEAPWKGVDMTFLMTVARDLGGGKVPSAGRGC
jgi:hypothetical protein